MITLKSLGGFVASMVVITSAFAQSEIVYNNTAVTLNSFYSSNLEVGDSVALGGMNRLLSKFEFEYNGSLTPDASKQGLVRVYANDASGAPDSTKLLYESDPFALVNGYASISISGITGVTLPDSVTWSFLTDGLGASENVGLLLYNPPSVGSSTVAFWEKNSFNVWTSKLLSGGAIPANFSARITAVPEPAVIQLGVLAGLALLGARALRKQS